MKIVKILYYALLDTKNLFRALFGYDIIKNLKEHNTNNKILNNLKFFDMINIIYTFCFIKLPFYCPKWVPKSVKLIFFGEDSKYIINENELDENNQCFIFINGILGNKKQAINSKLYLENFLNKPINILFNASDTLMGDLIEALIGKESDELTEASRVALFTICSKLLDENIKKIIVIAYSQGTIVISKVLSNLNRLGLNSEKYLKKLEIFCFSNCASKMKYIKNELPYIESFANENDFVAKLGCNCPAEVKDLIDIDGTVFINKNSYGHLFKYHYLNNFTNNYPLSKLNYYIN
jgi:hypothetical protein